MLHEHEPLHTWHYHVSQEKKVPMHPSDVLTNGFGGDLGRIQGLFSKLCIVIHSCFGRLDIGSEMLPPVVKNRKHIQSLRTERDLYIEWRRVRCEQPCCHKFPIFIRLNQCVESPRSQRNRRTSLMWRNVPWFQKLVPLLSFMLTGLLIGNRHCHFQFPGPTLDGRDWTKHALRWYI